MAGDDLWDLVKPQGGGTATADLWDLVKPPAEKEIPPGFEDVPKRALNSAFGAEPDPNYLRDLQAKSTGNQIGQAAGDLAGYEAGSFGALANRAVNFPIKLANKTLRLAEIGIGTFTGGIPEESPYIPEIPPVAAPHDPMADTLGEGVGMLATGAAAPAALGMSGGSALLPAAAMGATLNGVDMHQKVLQATGDPDKAMVALLEGAGVGAASALPVGRVLSHLNQESGGVLVRALGDLGTGFGVSAAQSSLNDVIQQNATGEDLPILKNALEQGGLGALTVFFAGTLASGAHGEGQAQAEPIHVESTTSAGKPHAATAEAVQNAETATPPVQDATPQEVVAAPPVGVVGVGDAAPGEVARESKPSAVATPEPLEQAPTSEPNPGGPGSDASLGSSLEGAAPEPESGAAPVPHDELGDILAARRADLRKPRTPEEIDAYIAEQEQSQKEVEDRLLGDKVREWRRATERDPDRAEAIEKEKGLSQAQVDSLYGIGDRRASPRDLTAIRDEISAMDVAADNPDPTHLVEEAARTLRKLGRSGNGPDEWMDRDPAAFAGMRRLYEIVGERGIDPVRFSKDAIKKAASAFHDPEDAAYMLEPFLKNTEKPPPRVELPAPKPSIPLRAKTVETKPKIPIKKTISVEQARETLDQHGSRSVTFLARMHNLGHEEAARLVDAVKAGDSKPEIPVERAPVEEKPPIPVEKAEKPKIPLRLSPEMQAHRARLLEKARAYDEANAKASITDVTPEGYGPDESAESSPPEGSGQTTEEQRLRSSINEAQTVLRGKMPPEKRAAIEKSLARTRAKLEADFPTKPDLTRDVEVPNKSVPRSSRTYDLPVEPPAPEPKAKLPVKPSSDALGLLKTNPLDILGLSSKPPVGGKNPEIMRGSSDGFYPSDETKWQALQRKIADRFVKLRGTEREAPGKGSDFSGAETRMHGRAAHAQDLLERAQDRAVAVMKERGLSAQDIADQATARHAPTRNRIISERTNGENLEGSGMSDARAADVRAKAKPGTDEVLRIHDEVRDKALDFAVESGLVSPDEAKAWREKFGDTFTSLKTISGDEPAAMPGVGKSLQVRGKEAKRAEGRTSEATNPFVSTFQNAQDIILRGEKNLVAQEFGKLVENNPGPWAEFEQPDGPHAPSGEDVFTYKDKGEPRYIRVRDDSTLKALKNLDPVAAGTLLRLAAKAGRMMSGLATSRNPDFVASNLARDLQTAVGNVSAEESVKRAATILKDVAPSLKEMFQAARNPEAAKGYAKEYLEHGALTDWIEPTTPQKRLADMEKRLAETPVREKLRALADAVNDLSGSVENGTRFAYFKALRRAGVSADEAAVRSKELTVNWSKKGEWSATMNALYLFSSASANGTVRFAQAWTRRPARAAAYAGTLAAAGYAMAMLNSAAGGKDEKDDRLWWDKQSDSNRRRYAMIQHEGGSTTRLPLAPGWGWFYYLGGKLYDAQKSGNVDIGDIVGSAVDQASPIGGGSVGQVVSPWFTDPLVSASENKDYAGRPIYSDRDEHDKRPYSALPGEQRASETSKAISKLANELTGGNDARQGMLDVPPRSLDYVAAEGGSGLGRFMQRVGKTISQTLHGEVPMWRDMPIVSRFKGDAPKTYSRDFYAITDQIEAEQTAMKGGKKFDANVLAYKTAASKVRETVQKLRAAGLDDAADKAEADFIKAFDARKKR